MRGRSEEKGRQRMYKWLKDTGHLPCLEKPRGNIPQSAIDHFRRLPYGVGRNNEGSEC